MVLGSGRISARTSLVVAILLAAVSSPAGAQSSIGFVGGGSVDPEQGYVGVFWESPDIGGNFRIRPGIDGGFGSDLRVGVINFDFIYRLPLGQTPWRFVTGGGPAISLTRYSDDIFDTGTELSAGGSYIFGFAHDAGFFTEFRIGGGNVPALKIGAGWRVTIQ
jgi:hypothetical protein